MENLRGPGPEGRTRGYKKRERTRNQLLDAAVAVLAEQGEAFSVSDVVVRAGVASGTFYNYFEDREALLDAVMPRLVHAFAAESAALAPREDPALRFATVSARVLTSAALAPQEARALLRIEAIPRALMEEGAFAHLREDLAEGFEAARFATGPDDAAVDLVSGTLLMGVRRIAHGRAEPGYEPRLLTQLLRSLGIPEGEVEALAERALEMAHSMGPLRVSGSEG